MTKLSVTDLGRFDFFLDIGCFQGFDAANRRAQAAGGTALATRYGAEIRKSVRICQAGGPQVDPRRDG